jgi:uncharacterized protein YndB with AHSA1/START domain
MLDNNFITTKYTTETEIEKSRNDVFNHLINLSKWWPEEFVGENIKLNSEFVFRTGEGHYSKNRVIEFVPNKKLVWLTTGSKRASDNFDWTGTKMIFELTPKGGNTLLKFTYDGVVLENESGRLIQICDMTIKDLFYNSIIHGTENKSFTATIEVPNSPQDVFKAITEDVAKWWGGQDFEGRSLKFNDEFIIHHPNTHYSRQKLIEVVPNKKIVWLVTEGTLHWLQKDIHEWTNTKMIFEINSKEDKTVLHFTHEGLVPEKECFAECEQGWTMVITDWLYHFIVDGKAHFKILTK